MNFLLLNFFEQIFKILKTFTGEITSDGILAIACVLFLITIITAILIACASVEYKTNKQTSKLNTYLSTKPFINDDNLLEFNKLMQRVPRNMREQWQKFMINRNDKASKFLNSTNCVDAIVRNGVYGNLVNSYLKYFAYIFGFALFILCMANEQSALVSNYSFFDMLAIPVVYVLANFVLIIIFKAIYNAIVNDLYHNMSIFERNIDRATSTLPDVIDYEVLFTKKEIRNNIPVLQEFLEQRAEYEEQQLQIARLNEVEHEVYDFSKLGVDGSIVMERALKESENYLANRRRILNEIDQITNEKYAVKKEFDDKLKESRQKINTHKETLAELNIQLQNTTGKIMADNIKNQMKDISKQIQIIEQDMDAVEQKFNGDIEKLDTEINARQDDINEKKAKVEKNLIHEFNEYSTRVNNAMKTDVSQDNQETIDKLNEEVKELKERLEQKDAIIDENNQILKDKDDFIAELSNQITQIEAEKQAIIDNANVIEKEVIKYFDADGREFFYDDENRPYYYGDNGEIMYYDYENSGDDVNQVYEEEYIPQEEIFEEPLEEVEEPLEEEFIEEELYEEEYVEEPQEEIQEEFEDEYDYGDEFEDEFDDGDLVEIPLEEVEEELAIEEEIEEEVEEDDLGISSIVEEPSQNIEHNTYAYEQEEDDYQDDFIDEEEVEEEMAIEEELEEEIEEDFEEEEDEEDEEEAHLNSTLAKLQEEIKMLKKAKDNEILKQQIDQLMREKQNLEMEKEKIATPKKGRGRPKGTFKVKNQPVQEEKRGRGRPKGTIKKIVQQPVVADKPAPKKRGRKSKRGRPRKNV